MSASTSTADTIKSAGDAPVLSSLSPVTIDAEVWRPRLGNADFVVSKRQVDTAFCLKYRVKSLGTGEERFAKPVEVDAMYERLGIDRWE